MYIFQREGASAVMRLKLFYGWYIVIAGLLLSAFNGALFSYGWTAFVNPILISFGWSMTQLSLASSLRSLETGVFNPVWGSLVDRYSARKLALLGLVTMALGIFVLSQTRNLAMYYGGFLIVGLGSSLAIGVLPVVVIAKWFKKDIGKANGLFYLGVGAGGTLVPFIVRIVDYLGWQRTLLYASIVLLVIGIPLSFVFRNRPEDYGMQPDGRKTDKTKGDGDKLADFGTSVKETLKTRAFWYLGVMNLCHAASISALMLYAIPYLTELGFSRTTAGTVVSLYTLVSVIVRLPMGALSDIFRKSHMVALSVTLQGLGLLLFWLIGSTGAYWLVLLFGITFGLGLGGAAPLRAPILSEYFGRKNFGTIWGLSTAFMTIGTVVSQPLAGWIYDTYRDYRVYWLGLVAFNLVVLIMMLTLPRARRAETAGVQTALPAKQ